ncbi:MAG: cytochrome c family protein [Gammaproteobacteria bacterium]|jgi:cytochrome c|nr:cytochrome c family protein [Gammaproteobacteria bacterium]
MRHGKTVRLMIAMSLIAACGGEEATGFTPRQTVLTAETLGDQTVAEASQYLSNTRYADTNRSNGATQAQICRACHSLENGGPNMIGPNLFGMFGRPAGQSAGFGYSEVLAGAGFIWTPRALDAWLAQPARFLPGNRMTFPGVMSETDRNDLIAYLLEVTDAGPGG